MKPLEDSTVEELFELFRSEGDSDALTRVFDRSAAKLLNLALHLCNDPCQAEDVLQETFLVAIEKAGRWDSERPLLPWLQGILFREARKARGRVRRTVTDLGHNLDPSDDAASPLHYDELRHTVEQALGRVPATYVAVLRRYLFDGETASELAQEFGREPGTIRVQLHRGLERLRHVLPAGFAFDLDGIRLPRGLDAIRETVGKRASESSAATAAGLTSVALTAILMNKKLAVIVLALVAMGVGALELNSVVDLPSPAGASTTTLAELPRPDMVEVAKPQSTKPERRSVEPKDDVSRRVVARPDPEEWTIAGRVVLASGFVPSNPQVFFVPSTPTGNADALPNQQARVTDEGWFEVVLNTPLDGQLVAIADGTDSLSLDPWKGTDLRTGGTTDVGVLELPLGARISGVAYQEGVPMKDGEVLAFVDALPSPDTFANWGRHEFIGGNKLGRWQTRASIQPDGRFEVEGLISGQEYQIVAIPEEWVEKHTQLEPSGTLVRAPTQGLELDWGMRVVRFVVTSANEPVPDAGVRQCRNPLDPRAPDWPIDYHTLVAPVYAGTDGRVDFLMPAEGVRYLQIVALGFLTRQVEFQPSSLLPGEEFRVELVPSSSGAELEVTFTGVDEQELDGSKIKLLTYIPGRGSEFHPPVPIVDGGARISRIEPEGLFFQYVLVGPEEVPGAPVRFFLLGQWQSALLESRLQPGERRPIEIKIESGGRIELDVRGAGAALGTPVFQVLEAETKEPASDLTGVINGVPAKLTVAQVSDYIWRPGKYLLRQVESDRDRVDVEFEVVKERVTVVKFELYR